MSAYLGIDVQASRGCAYALLDAKLRPMDGGWLAKAADAEGVAREAKRKAGGVAIGIDAPRCPLPEPRGYYWSRTGWRTRRPTEAGRGRHCEVVVAALKIANPQWTPTWESAPLWMRIGFEIFASLAAFKHVYEVFPSASYAQLSEEERATFCVSLRGFAAGPKDMLDAYVAAFTIHEYLSGRGAAVGGGDGLGAIILPRRPSRDLPGLLSWPAQ